MPRKFLAATALALGVSILFRFQAENVPRPALPPTYTQFPLEYVRLTALSFDAVAADILWIRFALSIPTKPADEPTGQALARQLRAIVELEPNFRAPYLHGSTLLTILGNQPCAALKILEEGGRRFPDDWRIPFQAGYNCFAEIGDPACAARHFARAASMSNSPIWLPRLAARLMAESSQLDAAVEYLTAQVERSTVPLLKDSFQVRLDEALLTRDLANIDEAIRTWRKNHDTAPNSIQRLIEAGLVTLPARMPFGGTYEIGIDGRARSTSGHTKLKSASTIAGAFTGELGERLYVERIEARLSSVLGKPFWVRSRTDEIAAAAGLVSAALQGLETVRRFETDSARIQDLRVFEARSILRVEIDRMKAAYLELLREHLTTPSLDEIQARAGTPAVDPFGSSYVLDREGLPSAAANRHPMVVMRGSQTDDPCR